MKRIHFSNSGRTCQRQTSRSQGNNRSLYGFTLAEILVVMAMTAIMMAVTMTSLSGARDRKAVEAEARKLAATIREVQNYALTGKKFDTGEPTCFVGADAVAINLSSVDFVYYLRNANSSCPLSGVVGALAPASVTQGDDFIQTFSLGNGIVFHAATPMMVFSIPRGEMFVVDESTNSLIAPSDGFVRYELFKEAGDDDVVYSVCVYPTGRVEDVSGASCS